MQTNKRLATPDPGDDEHTFKKFKSAITIQKTIPQLNSQIQVKILFWNSPHEFYVQIEDGFKDYEDLMRRIQSVYNNKSAINTIISSRPLDIDDYVVAKNRKDNFWYRAVIVDHNSQLQKYKVQFVDVGNCQITAEEFVHPLEEEFTKMPIKAINVSLKNIVSCDDNAKLTSNLSRYINPKNTVTCDFSLSENGRYFATVQVDGKDLKSSLIDDNYVVDLPETVNLPILVGQMMKLPVVKISSLLHFYAKINGVLIPCSHYDAARAKIADGFINFQQNYENKCCVARILTVSNSNVLMVALSVMNDFPEPIYHSVYVTSQKSAVTVHNVEDVNVLLVKLSAIASQYDVLLEEINTFYQVQEPTAPLQQFNRKKLHACKSQLDNRWYRVKILKNNALSSEVQIELVDIRRTEIVSRENIRTLEERFQYINSPLLKLYLPYRCVDDSQRQSIINEVKSLTNGYDLTMNLERAYKNVCIGSISHMDVAMEKILLYKQLVKPVEMNKVYEEIDSKELEDNTNSLHIVCNFERCVLGYISHVIDPENFYVQLKNDENLLEELVADLQVSVPTFQQLEAVNIGEDCYAFCSEYTCWYRAKIIEKIGEIITVQYIDYGNTEDVTVDNLKKPPSESFTPLARLCSLPVTSKGDTDWYPDAVSLLKALVGEEIYFETLATHEDRIYINLGSKTENLSQFLIDNNFAEFFDPANPIDMSVKSIQTGSKKIGGGLVQVVLFLSPQEFYIQFKDSIPALDTLGELLAQAELFDLTNPEIGDILAARFAEDGLLYRAKVISTGNGDGVMVHFIDYGNTTIATEFRKLPDKLKNIPPFAWTCNFEKVDNLNLNMLEEFLFEENAFFQVQVVDTLESGCRIIRLLKDGMNILDLFGQKAHETIDEGKLEK